MKNRRGSALLLVVVLSAVLMVLGVILCKMIYNNHATVSSLVAREQAFWLAEAGLAAGKVELVRNAGWYTDLSHFPEDDVSWLREAAVGRREMLGEGSYKVVREKDKDRLYSLGFKGKAVVILKREFTTSPFRSLLWKEI